ncbi:uncharacterized protein [Euphorbia lathyris]|uniref:uncharacterized protein n=1 Tax=Euphorbia lathyris TaxID=212925 RepID=UPI003313FF92
MLSLRLGTFHSLHCLSIIVLVFVKQALLTAAITVPSSSCYVLDNSSRVVDFGSWIGHHFEYEGKENTDLAVRFCKDVEKRSQKTGYVAFGRFNTFNHFTTGSGHVDFVQRFYGGDLANCENSYDKLGRTAQVNIICGNCLNGQCKGGLGCICNVTYESDCRVLVELAMPCEKRGPRIFEGFTVGFHPRSWEIVYNGMTQLGYERSRKEFSFSTEQTHIALYMTAIASLSTLVKKPVIKVLPEKGLEVRLSGSGAVGTPPTTLTPAMLILDWRCQEVHDTPYEVNVTIPVEGYEPVQFVLSKLCEKKQNQEVDSRQGWVVFGVLSCIFFVLSTVFCCAGFIYKTRVERLHGLDALPGMTILSACLETASGELHGYMQSDGANGGYSRAEASWEQPSTSEQGTWIKSEKKYGSV